MYVDDSGSTSRRDHTDHFILAGIIVEDYKIKDLQKAVFEYKQQNFTGDFVDAEIHTYDMYKRQGRFASLDHTTKLELLDRLYEMIRSLDCVGIVSVIDKRKFQFKQPTWDALTVSWSFLLEWYDKHLKENSIRDGKISVDKSTNKTQHDIIRIIDGLRSWGTRCLRIPRPHNPSLLIPQGCMGYRWPTHLPIVPCSTVRKTSNLTAIGELFAANWGRTA